MTSTRRYFWTFEEVSKYATAVRKPANIIKAEAQNLWQDKFDDYKKVLINNPQLLNAHGFYKAMPSLILAGKVRDRNGQIIEEIQLAS